MKIFGIKYVSNEYWIPVQKDISTVENVSFITDFKNRKKKNVEFIAIEVSVPTVESGKLLLERKFDELNNILTFISNSYWHFDKSLKIFPSKLNKEDILNFTKEFNIAHYYWKDDVHLINQGFRNKLKTLMIKRNSGLQEPLSQWRAGFEAQSLSESFLNYYKVIEYFKHGQRKIDKWISIKDPNCRLFKTKHGGIISNYTIIRNEIAHNKQGKTTLNPIKGDDLNKIKDNINGIKDLSVKIIDEHIKPIAPPHAVPNLR